MASSTPGFYGRIARFAFRRWKLVFLLALAVTALSGLGLARLRVDSDILSLMPEGEPSTEALARLDREEGGVNVLTIAVAGGDQAARDAWLDQVAARMRALESVDYVLWDLDPDLAFRLGLLQLPAEDLATIRDRVRAALSLGSAIQNPFIASRVLDLGPLTERLQQGSDELRLAGPDGIARLVVRPRGSAHDIPFARAFMHDTDRILAELAPSAGEVRIAWIGGAYRHNVEDYESILKDIGWTAGASFVLVLVIIAAAFRAPRAVFLIFAPLMVSNVWTLGAAGATVGSLNSFTSFTNAIIIGLGVEFGVHLYARIRELREAGRAVEDAVVEAWDLVGGACTSAALTSSAGFAALLAAHFTGFRQLGWLLTLGLLLTLVAEVVLMPALLAVVEPKEARHTEQDHHRRRRRRLPAIYQAAAPALMVVAALSVVAAMTARDVRFEYDLSALRKAGLAYADLTEEERGLARQSYAPLIASFPDDATLTDAHVRLARRMEEGRLPEIAQVISIRTLLPANQEEQLAILREIAALSADPNAPYLPASVRDNLAHVAATPLTTMTAADLPHPLRHALGAANGAHRLLLIPTGNMWDMRETARLEDVVARELPGQVVAGEYLTLGVLYRLMKRDAPVIAGIAFALVCTFTALDLRRLRPTLGALAVQVAGMAWWSATLVLFGIKLSIVNFVGIPIVLGIGIDVMIHLIHRLNQEGPGGILKALGTTGWASALGTSTTVVAFAALSFASGNGIRSLGRLVLLGEGAVTVAGFVLVPLGFAWLWDRKGHKPPTS
jgi:predicted RND superfamily exporter protein